MEKLISSWQLAHPGWVLLLALVIPFLVRVKWPLARGLRGRLPLVLRLAWMASIVLALAGPSFERQHAAVAVAALVDVSDSVGEPELDRARAVLATLHRESTRDGRDIRLAVARFARSPVEVTGAPAGWAQLAGPATARFEGAAGEETDLALALGWGLARLDPDRVGRVLLLTDGRSTRGDLLEQAERARRRGVRVFVHRFEAAPIAVRPDVALASLIGPPTVRPGESFELEARVVATRPTSARLRLRRDSQPAGAEWERTVPLAAGIGVVRMTTRLATDAPALYRLEIVEADHNSDPRNNLLTLALAPESRPRVLVVEPTADGTAAFRRALAAEQIEVQTRVGHTLPDLDRPDGPDLVVLSDTGTGLSETSVTALDRFVRERGGGLIVSGAPESLAGTGPARLDPLLPLVYDTSEQKLEATLALGLIIDQSGSMSGPKMELTKEAARGAAELMNAQDLITVVTFDSQAQTVVRLQPASNRQRILSDIAQIRASGGTNVLPGLQEAFDQLLSARARKKHAVVLSDGQSPAEGVRELVDEAAGAGITISAVGVGDGADLALLQTIATRGGGRFYHTRDPASIPRIFTREATQFSPSNLVDAPSRVRPARPAQVTAGIPFASAPPLGGYARARPKKGAEVLLVSGSGEPLLARWQIGLGQVLAWTSDLTERWSSEWLRWRHWNKLWGQIVRSALRRQGSQWLPLTVALQADRAVVEIRAFDAEDRPLPGLQGTLSVTDVPSGGPIPGQSTRSLPLLASGAGVYRSEVPLGEAASLLLSADLRSEPPAARARFFAHGRLAIPPLREHLPPGAEQANDALSGGMLLRAVAARTGGREIQDDVAPLLEAGSDRVQARRPLRRELLLAALALFLAEIAARRVKFRRPDRAVSTLRSG